MKKHSVLIWVCILLFISFCKKENSVELPPNKTSLQIDYEQLDSAFAQARSNNRIICLIVSGPDSIYQEEYFRANAATTPHDVMSATKSVMSILVGIAIDKGIIPSVDQPIDGYIRPLVSSLDSAKGAITIHQLLTMSCGLEWSEIPGPSEFIYWYYSPDHLLYILNKPLVSQPGQVFNYSDGAAHLMSVVLSQAAGMTAKEFATQNLFTPLGIGDRTWTTDNRGFNFGGVRLFLLPEDMVKIGRLMLQDGKYGSQQIVSKEWVATSTGFQITTNQIIPYGSSYGYYWWRGSANSYDFYFANGHGGQFIVIVPKINLIVVGTTDWSGLNDTQAGQLWYSLISIIVNQVLPAFQLL
jgi:CubicO group peptidase (beta-lactamase class C family)